MYIERNRLYYFILIILVMVIGLGSRSFSVYLPKWVNLYIGDMLWALMVFFMVGFLFRGKNTFLVAGVAILFSFSIEVSQLYNAPWFDALRGTRIGRLVFGYGFLWRDLISYSIGVSVGVLLENFIVLKTK